MVLSLLPLGIWRSNFVDHGVKGRCCGFLPRGFALYPSGPSANIFGSVSTTTTIIALDQLLIPSTACSMYNLGVCCRPERPCRSLANMLEVLTHLTFAHIRLCRWLYVYIPLTGSIYLLGHFALYSTELVSSLYKDILERFHTQNFVSSHSFLLPFLC